VNKSPTWHLLLSDAGLLEGLREFCRHQ